MLNDGSWLDDDQWQPAGCMLHTYQPPDISRCLNHSHILYIGDTRTQHRFFSMAALMDKAIDNTTTTMDRKYEFEELTVEFWWDPFLNSTRTLQYLQYSGAVAASAGIARPSLLVVGGSSLSSWPQWQAAMDRVFEAVRRTSQVADAVLISPSDNDSANAYLATQQQTLQPRTPFAIPFVWTRASGWETQLALNYRCNDLRPKHFPYTATCCFHYPKPRWYQNTLFAVFLILVPAGLYLGDTGKWMGGGVNLANPSLTLSLSLYLSFRSLTMAAFRRCTTCAFCIWSWCDLHVLWRPHATVWQNA